MTSITTILKATDPATLIGAWTLVSAVLSIVNKTLQLAPGGLYAYAVYNLGTDFVFNWAPDIENFTFFSEARTKFGIDTAVIGTITSSSDVSTAAGYTQPKFTEMLNMFDLQTIKTPWGRAYMGYAQQYGSIVGIS